MVEESIGSHPISQTLHTSNTSKGGHRGRRKIDATNKVVVIFDHQSVVAERRDLHTIREQKQRVRPHSVRRATGDLQVPCQSRHWCCREVDLSEEVIARVSHQCDATDRRDAHTARVVEERVGSDAIRRAIRQGQAASQSRHRSCREVNMADHLIAKIRHEGERAVWRDAHTGRLEESGVGSNSIHKARGASHAHKSRHLTTGDLNVPNEMVEGVGDQSEQSIGRDAEVVRTIELRTSAIPIVHSRLELSRASEEWISKVTIESRERRKGRGQCWGWGWCKCWFGGGISGWFEGGVRGWDEGGIRGRYIGGVSGWYEGGIRGRYIGGLSGWYKGRVSGWDKGGLSGWYKGGISGWDKGGVSGWNKGGLSGWLEGGFSGGLSGWREGGWHRRCRGW
jgi:hypothetical protein